MAEAQANPRLGFKLTYVTGGKPFEPRPLPRGVSYIGRDEDNDVVLGSTLVSRRHAKLLWTSTGLTVHDLDSHNGVFLNGKKVRSKPVAAGDRLYFADVCVRVEAATSVPVKKEPENQLDQILEGTRGPNDMGPTRNLDALMHAADLLVQPDVEMVASNAIAVCQTLTDATLAVLVLKEEDGSLNAAATLRQDGGKGDPPVNWPVVRRAIDESRALFTADASKTPLIEGDVLANAGGSAIMVAPIVEAGFARGAIFLSREGAHETFTERELETLAAIANIVSSRLYGRDGAHPEVKGDTEEGRVVDDQRSVLEAEVARLKEENDALKRDGVSREALTDDLQTLRADVENLNKALQQRSNALADKAKTLANKTKAFEELQTAFAGFKEEAESQQQASQLETVARAQQADDLKNTIEANKAAFSQLQEQLKQTEATLSRVDGEMRKAKSDAESMTSALSEAAEKSAADIAALEGEKAALTASLESRVDRQDIQKLFDRSLSPRIARRLMGHLEGESPKAISSKENAVVVFCALHGLDEWAPNASPDEVKKRMDGFVAAVRTVGKKLGAEVDIPAGGGHVVVFPADENGLRAALSFSAKLLRALPTEEGGIQGGIHLGVLYRGAFGSEDAAVDMVLGEAFAVARGACEYADAGTVLVTDAVKSGLGEDGATMFILKGPHLIRGFKDPFNISQLSPRALP